MGELPHLQRRAPDVDAVVRDATTADCADIARLARAALAATYAGLVDRKVVEAIIAQTYSPTALRTCIAGCQDAPDAHFLVARVGGRLHGYLHYDCFGEQPELHRLYVDPATTSRGIGATLIHALERRLTPGTTYILLVLADNFGALRFYAREGFEEAGRLPDGLPLYARSSGVAVPSSAPLTEIVVLRKRITAPGS